MKLLKLWAMKVIDVLYEDAFVGLSGWEFAMGMAH